VYRIGSSFRLRPTQSWCILLTANLWAACNPAADAPDEDELAPSLSTVHPAPSVAPTTQVSPQNSSARLSQDRNTAIVRAASRVAPAVVSISVIRTQRTRPQSFWETFYMPRGAERRSAGFGSGVIVDQGGIIVTNNHVIEGADRIQVTLPNGMDAEAELVGADARADIAVLRIENDELPVAPVGSSDGLLIGEWAIAIGNPLGTYVGDTEPTVTAGVVSALDRNIAPSSGEEGFYLGMIQTDAAINPGNSGGALVNSEGEVIGINASIISRSGGSEGLGFAIPIDRALRIADDLLRFGEVRRAWIGVEVEPVEADLWGRTRGVRISRVAPGSPGDLAALEPGDRLLTVNTRSLTDPLDFEGVLLDLRAGDPLSLNVEGQARSVELKAVAYPSLTAERVDFFQDIQLITVSPQIRAERDLVTENGAMIAGIPEELSDRIGLQLGDVILGVNRIPVRSARELTAIFENFSGEARVTVTFERNRGMGFRDLVFRR